MGKRVLMIIAHSNFRDEELLETKKVLEDAGCTVRVASTDTVPARGMFGAFVKPDMTLDRVTVDNYDAVIFVGGSGAEVYFNNPTAHLLAREAWEKKKVLGAICIAPCILANAGLLKGKTATVWDGRYVEILTKKGASYTGRNVEIDGKIVTANGPESAEEFGKAIVKALS
ncbi:MAG: DJ-1/PfpI family protein [Thermoplasmatales archaeon]|nr:DJ-1/PfpI family protein [Thermoplasmatales archaeon]